MSHFLCATGRVPSYSETVLFLWMFQTSYYFMSSITSSNGVLGKLRK